METPEAINDAYTVTQVLSSSPDPAREITIAKKGQGHLHAEDHLIIKLRSFFSPVPRHAAMDLNTWINVSPRGRCSDGLLSFFPDVSLCTSLWETVFLTLYGIQENREIARLGN